ncbi:mannonate dehydratase [Microbacterium sp. H1-D42]|uniref:mannonate dehydratase n=1 Tax=Microbacterium sp. H1-D42 TaxID=2925844 RepID=UPI001F534C67|nr:mannonate dehydratase [Microbacterium sp. H1-D42]UNK70444.1 mannonate dehydratase [Microbacterium sp. H1-D42]
MIQLSEFLPPRPASAWKLIRQAGVNNVVAALNGGEQDQRMFASVGSAGWTIDDRGDVPWSLEALRHNKEIYEKWGFTLIATEDTAPMDKIRLGQDGRDEQIDQFIEQIRALGALGVPTMAYNWMAITTWGRTETALQDRGGALVTGYNQEVQQARAALLPEGEVTAEDMWSALEYFLAAVVPEAEKAGVRLAMHPDDPPQGMDRGVPRIMSSVADFRRLFDIAPSDYNGTTFCQGNFALMPEVISGETSIPDVIREFGTAKIPFVHFRDVRGTVADFRETFHDDGQTDMPACVEAYHEIGFEGSMRPDHVPTLEGESNDAPGYEMLGRLFAIGYIRGLEQSAYGHPAARTA